MAEHAALFVLRGLETLWRAHKFSPRGAEQLGISPSSVQEGLVAIWEEEEPEEGEEERARRDKGRVAASTLLETLVGNAILRGRSEGCCRAFLGMEKDAGRSWEAEGERGASRSGGMGRGRARPCSFLGKHFLYFVINGAKLAKCAIQSLRSPSRLQQTLFKEIKGKIASANDVLILLSRRRHSSSLRPKVVPAFCVFRSSSGLFRVCTERRFRRNSRTSISRKGRGQVEDGPGRQFVESSSFFVAGVSQVTVLVSTSSEGAQRVAIGPDCMRKSVMGFASSSLKDARSVLKLTTRWLRGVW